MKRALFLSCLFSVTFSVSIAQTVIQMVQKNGVYYIEGTVDGVPMQFIFDTGASEVSITVLEATFLLKQGKLTRNDFIGYSRYEDANGGISIGMIINISDFEIGHVHLKDVRASVVRNLEAPLLLGGSVLNRLGKFTLDPSNSTLTIYNSKNEQNSAPDVTGRNTSTSKTPELKGDVAVNTNAPILVTPSPGSPVVGTALNNTVTIVRKVNDKFYYVRSGPTSGYLWVGWLK